MVALERLSDLAVPGECLRNLFKVNSWAPSLETQVTGPELGQPSGNKPPRQLPAGELGPHWGLSCATLSAAPGGRVGSNCREGFYICCRARNGFCLRGF